MLKKINCSLAFVFMSAISMSVSASGEKICADVVQQVQHYGGYNYCYHNVAEFSPLGGITNVTGVQEVYIEDITLAYPSRYTVRAPIEKNGLIIVGDALCGWMQPFAPTHVESKTVGSKCNYVPVSSFVVSQTPVNPAGSNIATITSTSTDADSDIVSYLWMVDGVYAGNGNSLIKSSRNGTTINVELTVTDAADNTSTTSRNVTLEAWRGDEGNLR
jgi:hypothetical protein